MDLLGFPSLLARAVVSGISAKSLVGSLNPGGFRCWLPQGDLRYLQPLPWRLHPELFDMGTQTPAVAPAGSLPPPPRLSMGLFHLDEEILWDERELACPWVLRAAFSGCMVSTDLPTIPTSAWGNGGGGG